MEAFFVGVKSLILYNRKTLLLKHSESRKWEYPGGAMKFGEGIHEALRREVREETGLEIEIDGLLLAMTAMVGERQCVGLTYLSHSTTGDVNLSQEHTDSIWANRKQLVSLLSKPMLHDLLENNVLDALDID